jgi:hypothetical protein
MSMADFAHMKDLQRQIDELRLDYADLLLRLQALEQKKTTLEMPRKTA